MASRRARSFFRRGQKTADARLKHLPLEEHGPLTASDIVERG